ncbi:MAG TPA: hypothetical protein HA272_03955 [Methanoregula sp.]|nr:hypothetical protein [Methanoregula sp.]
MKQNIQWGMGACAIIVIACVLITGCTIFQPATPPAPTASPGTDTIPEQTPAKEVPQSCEAYGGTVCPSGQVCDGTMVRSSDSSRCCEGKCVVPTGTKAPATTTAATTTKPTAITATTTVTAVPPDYIPPPTSGPTPGATEPVQTPEAHVPMDCATFGGHICLSDETCSGSLVESSDSSRCCAGTCTMIASATAAPTSVAPVVIPGKTCSEFGGNICVAPQTCTGSLVTTDDTTACCAGDCA